MKLKKFNNVKLIATFKLITLYIFSLFFNPKFILKKRNIIAWDVDKRKIEIELTTRCSRACYNCNRSVRQAPSDEYISISQIEKFITESIKSNWKWKRISLTDGEPTLHPSFFEILGLIKRYKDFNSRCKIFLFTNGFGKKVNEVLSALPNWINVINSNKKSNSNKFSSYNIAPVDLDEFENKSFSQGCRLVDYCGLGLNRYGFYPCGPGAGVDRIFGFDIGIKKLNLIDKKNLGKQLNILCMYCGHFKDKYGYKIISKEAESDTWVKAYVDYIIKKPTLVLY